MDGVWPEERSPLPGEAPLLLWVGLLAAVVWWLWPWVAPRLPARRKAEVPAEARSLAADRCETAGRTEAAVPDRQEVPAGADAAVAVESLGFDPADLFAEVFEVACRCVAKALDTNPRSPEYAAATSAFKLLEQVIDRIFQAWGGERQEVERLCRLREDSTAFSGSFGAATTSGPAARELLEAAGFTRQQREEGNEASGCWVFRHEEAAQRLRAMAVRLCLQKLGELQRLRGTLRWVQSSNAAVVPKPEAGALPELMLLYSSAPSLIRLDTYTSARERHTETAVRTRLNAMRSEAGCSPPLVLHEGLVAAARSLAYKCRLTLRSGATPRWPGDAEVRDLLGRVALPPGVDAACLHWTSTELPHIFGLSSTRGGAGADRQAAPDEAAEVMANEAAGFWRCRQEADMLWPAAAVCGVGVALDYTVNRGFMAVLLAGYEGSSPGGSERSEVAEQLLRRRRGTAPGAAGAAASVAARPFGARVCSLGGGETRLTHAK